MKMELRKMLLEERDKIENKYEKSCRIYLNLKRLEVWKKSKIIHTYITFRSEVDTRLIINNALIEGKRVLCPKIMGNNLLIGEIKSFNDLTVGKYGILEPINIISINLEDIDIIIVPGIAFDLKGYRLGYGGGYYDRFLKNLKRPIKIGLIFDQLIKKELPHTNMDIKMDIIISENRVIFISKEYY
jgi:5-formyltetrahydrofolate cyclo-ligase